MKQFVGYVNGKTFYNEEDFNKAAQDAVKSCNENISISSYYKYSNENEDPKFVSTYEYFIGDKKPDVEEENHIEYKLSDGLKGRIEEASNRDDIKKSVEYHISQLDKRIDNANKDIQKAQKEIYKITERSKEYEHDIQDLNGRKKYYELILETINGVEDKCNDCGDATDIKKVETPDKDKVRSILGIDGNTTLSEFLKQIGLLN